MKFDEIAVVDSQEMLQDGIYDMWIETDLAKDAKLVVTIEDAAKTGGIGSLTASCLCEYGFPRDMLICAFPDEPITHGSIDELDKFYKMDSSSIIKRIEDKLNG